MKKQSNEYENIRGKDMRLPIGIQTFSKMRDNYYYVDKTQYIYELLNHIGDYFFLSRPRRFGKSLLIDTMKELFSGNKELFKDLYIYDKWDWDDKYPVIKISFGAGKITTHENICKTLLSILNNLAIKENFDYSEKLINFKFQEAIQKISKKYNSQVVVLIDEYDKPILDTIDDSEICSKVRDELKNFYSVIKDSDKYIKFCFLTGVSKFSKVSIFSGLNNLYDITLSKKFSAICGYTQHDLETVFKDRFEKLSLEDKTKVKKWYNGYSWTGESVYNPFDILLYFEEKKLKSYWFRTGSPEFLSKLLIKNQYYIPNVFNKYVSESMIDSFNINNISLTTLLFQTGYLTIAEENVLETDIINYKLSYPNKEVEIALSDLINYTLTSSQEISYDNQMSLRDLLNSENIVGFRDLFQSFYASIPNDWYRKNAISNYEGYYASIFYTYFSAQGYEVIPEDSTNHGKIDMTVIYQGICYIFEFKVNEYCEQGNALQQIKHKKYYEKYQNRDDVNKTYIVGVEFSKDEKNITNFEYELLKNISK